MEWWTEIRRKVLAEGASKRAVQHEYGIHWRTLEKILAHGSPPGYRMRAERPKPKIGPYLERIRQIIEEDKRAPKKQRHTAKRIFERIRSEGYEGGSRAGQRGGPHHQAHYAGGVRAAGAPTWGGAGGFRARARA